MLWLTPVTSKIFMNLLSVGHQTTYIIYSEPWDPLYTLKPQLKSVVIALFLNYDILKLRHLQYFHVASLKFAVKLKLLIIGSKGFENKSTDGI